MQENKYKHIIWDLDHTLWDFKKNSRKCIAMLLREFDLLDFPIRNEQEFLDDYTKINYACWADYREGRLDKETLRYIRFQKAFELHNVQPHESKPLAIKFGEAYVEHGPKQTELMPGTFEILEYLKKRDYNQVILTNGFLESQEVKMVNSGLRPYFSHEFVSEVVGAKKPDPIAYHAVLKALNAEVHECIMIGDSEASDIQGAVNVGMDSVHFQPEIRKQTQATHSIKELLELKEIL